MKKDNRFIYRVALLITVVVTVSAGGDMKGVDLSSFGLGALSVVGLVAAVLLLNELAPASERFELIPGWRLRLLRRKASDRNAA